MDSGTTLCRRDFIKGVGTIMGAVGLAGTATGAHALAQSAGPKEGGRATRKGRNDFYPWWVREVDEITTELDPAIHQRPSPLNYLAHVIQLWPEDKWNSTKARAKEYVKEGIVKNIPGRSLPDVALNYAEAAYSGGAGSFDSPRLILVPGSDEITTYNVHPPQDFGLEPWQATPEEASKVVQQAGIQLGAALVRFTELKPQFLYGNVKIDASAENIERVGRVTVIPERFKYVAVIAAQAPRDLTVRGQSMLGAAGDRAGYSQLFVVRTRIHRFLAGLGYGVIPMQTLSPVIAHAVYAGMGELGRMNRMINPLFGGNVRLECLLTDLPLAADRPIDFGLQEFCKKCKICAEACPSGALSLADEPSWEPFNQFQSPGKKTYFEDNERCGTYISERDNRCSSCLAVCPWSKGDKTALHDIAKILASKTPQAGNLLTKLDEAFGYGLVELDSEEMADWWDLDIPELGIDTYQGKL
jgi:reductive dehalogenase